MSQRTRQDGTRPETQEFREVLRHTVIGLASLAIVLIVPIGLLLARVLGSSPTTQVFTALETIAANLCWVPPLVGHFTGSARKDFIG